MAQPVFTLGIYTGEYPPPQKKKPIKFFFVFGPRILHCYKKPVADPGGGDASPTGTHSAPKLAILRSKIESWHKYM